MDRDQLNIRAGIANADAPFVCPCVATRSAKPDIERFEWMAILKQCLLGSLLRTAVCPARAWLRAIQVINAVACGVALYAVIGNPIIIGFPITTDNGLSSRPEVLLTDGVCTAVSAVDEFAAFTALNACTRVL